MDASNVLEDTNNNAQLTEEDDDFEQYKVQRKM